MEEISSSLPKNAILIPLCGTTPPQNSDEPFGNNAYKTLKRGISRATDNVNIVSQARSELVLLDSAEDELPTIETPVYTFILPDLTSLDDKFRLFIEKDLIAVAMQNSLEQATRLNWWSGFCQRLWPLSTSGDGNCLLHAASLGMWGFHDRLLCLRRALHAFLSFGQAREALWRRWRRQQTILNSQFGLVYTEQEWRREWNAIVSMASTVPRMRRHSISSSATSETEGDIYESLEEIHVLALAHVLKRPIIVIADTILKDMNGEALAPIQFGGVYLPFEYYASDCHRSPLLLAYDGGHFSALVAMETPNSVLSSAIPIVDSNGELLPLQFPIDPGNNEQNTIPDKNHDLSLTDSLSIISEYLDIVKLDPQGNNESSGKNGLFGSLGRSVGNKFKSKLSRTNSVKNLSIALQSKYTFCALINTDKKHEYHDVMIKNYLQTAAERFRHSSYVDQTPRYGAGKSRFYAEADSESHEKVGQMTPVKAVTNIDSTMYLSKSTFYDTVPQNESCRTDECPFFGSSATKFLCSKCYKQQQNDNH